MSSTDKIKRLLFSGIFLFLIGFIILNQGYFAHTHQLKNGTVVTHAHPYNKGLDDNKSPFSSHEHSTAEYILISSINVFQLLILFILVFHFIFQKKHEHTSSFSFDLKPVELYRHSSGRSPPFIK